MAKATFCNTCIFWEKDIIVRAGEKFGICKEPTASSKMIQDTESSFSEDSVVYTEGYFGCVYWRENRGVLIDLSEVVPKEIIEKKSKEIAEELANKEIVNCEKCGTLNLKESQWCVICNNELNV